MSLITENFIHRIEYTDWGNRRSLDALSMLQPVPEQGLKILSHAVLSQMTHFDRVKQRPARRGFWLQLSPEELQSLIAESTAEWLEFMSSQTETSLQAEIPYVTSRGESFRSSILVIATHMINHSTYHRGQVALIIRNAGGEPPMTDYLVYARGR